VSRRQAASGFTLITAIFLLVVVAGMVVYMTNIRVAQQTTVVYGLQGARALQAARSGLEWGIFQSINNDVCAGSTVINDAAFAGFSVDVQCTPTTHIEGDPATGTIVNYRLTAIARSGVYGSLDYVQRHLQANVSLDPP
jgi:MSHA biogenesis protein MshP